MCLNYKAESHQEGIWNLCCCQSQPVSASEQRHHVLLLSRFHLGCNSSVTSENPLNAYEKTVFNNGCSPYSTHVPGMKPLCITWGQTPGTPNTLINQKLLTAVAWFSAIFMTTEALPTVFPLRHGRGSSSSFFITPHKTESLLTHPRVSHVLFYFQSIIISIVVILLVITSDLLQLWSLPFPPFLTSVTILPIIKQETEVNYSQQRSNIPQTIFLPCYVFACDDAVVQRWHGLVVGCDIRVYCTSYPASFSTANIAQLWRCSHTALRSVMTYITLVVCTADSFW